MLNNFLSRSVGEIMCKNIVEPDRPQMTIWFRRIACWIPKAEDTHPEYVLLIAFLLQQWLHERASMLLTLPFLLRIHLSNCVSLSIDRT
jgi:hypothetical protein